jgi:hypothetical protein
MIGQIIAPLAVDEFRKYINKMNQWTLALLIATCLALTGCGQKGALYLTDDHYLAQ